MSLFRPRLVVGLVAAGGLVWVGCTHGSHNTSSTSTVPPPSAVVTTRPAVATVPATTVSARLTSAASAPSPAVEFAVYTNSTAGISLEYPIAWQSAASSTSCLKVVQPGAALADLCLDIPKLPWHVPGMIPLGMVASDYASDVKKNEISDAVVEENAEISVSSAKARRVISAGHRDGKARYDMAVVAIHGDAVFIVSVDADDAGKAPARAALDHAVASIKWLK